MKQVNGLLLAAGAFCVTASIAFADKKGADILGEFQRKELKVPSPPTAVDANYPLGLNVDGGWIGHSGALQTYCEVNPEKRQLRMWMVQLRGEAGGYVVKSDVIDAIRKAGADFTAEDGK